MSGTTYIPVVASRLPQPAGRVRQSNVTTVYGPRSPAAPASVVVHADDAQQRGRSVQAKVTRAVDERARRSFLSPKERWSPDASSFHKAVPKYQLRDPGAVPGSPPLAKRTHAPAPTSDPALPLARSSHTAKSSRWSADQREAVSRISTRTEATTAYARAAGVIASRAYRATARSPPPSSISSGRTNRSVPVPSGLPHPRPYVHPKPSTLHAAHDAKGDEADSPQSNAATVASASPAPKARTAQPTYQRDSIAMPPTRTSSAVKYMRDVQICSTSASADSRSHSSSSSTSSSSDPRSTLITPERSLSSLSSETSETDMTLIWQPDPEQRTGGPDPAEQLWKEIELRLGSHRGPSRPLPHPDTFKASHGRQEERGQWVLTPRQAGAASMEKAESEFTVSAYFDPDMTVITPRLAPALIATAALSVSTSATATATGNDREQDTALFDMSAPLVHSRSNDAVTPANSPLLRPDTIQRKSRVERGTTRPRKSGQGTDSEDPSSRSTSSDSLDSLRLCVPDIPSGRDEREAGPGMYRLDSHVVAALQAFSQGDSGTTPHLDLALSASSSSVPEIQVPFEDGGLGLGIHLGSTYSQPVTSPPMSSSQRATRMRSISSLSQAIQKGREREVISVKNLDTGLRRDMTLRRMDGAIRV